ncbi:MAG: hypothetical protein JWR26_1497 [Pedosphaera sp.]|nr:hypothetical protein [Pedosphaera sp.]
MIMADLCIKMSLQPRERAGHSGNSEMVQVPACGGLSRGGGPSWTSWAGLGGSREAGVRERDRGANWPKKGCPPCACRRFLPLAAASCRLPPLGAGCRRIFFVYLFFLRMGRNGNECVWPRVTKIKSGLHRLVSLRTAWHRLARFFSGVYFFRLASSTPSAFALRELRSDRSPCATAGALQEEGRAKRSAPH